MWSVTLIGVPKETYLPIFWHDLKKPRTYIENIAVFYRLIFLILSGVEFCWLTAITFKCNCMFLSMDDKNVFPAIYLFLKHIRGADLKSVCCDESTGLGPLCVLELSRQGPWLCFFSWNQRELLLCVTTKSAPSDAATFPAALWPNMYGKDSCMRNKRCNIYWCIKSQILPADGCFILNVQGCVWTQRFERNYWFK